MGRSLGLMVAGAVVAIALAGCGASDRNRPNLMQYGGQLRFEPDRDDRHVIWAHMLNSVDIGFDVDKRHDRHSVVLTALSKQCGAPVVEGDWVTQTGASEIHTLRLYTMRIRCPLGALREAG